jgi:hypothetical protein
MKNKDPIILVQILKNTFTKQGLKHVSISLYMVDEYWCIDLFDQSEDSKLLINVRSWDSEEKLIEMFNLFKGQK